MEERRLVQQPLFEIPSDEKPKTDGQPEEKKANLSQVIIDPDKASLRDKIPLPRITRLSGKDRAAGERDDE